VRPTKETGILTVADVREARGKDGGIEALFNERQQIFEFPHSKTALAKRLHEALERGEPVKAVLNPRRGILERVDAPSERELREFAKQHVLLEAPERPFKVDLARIDPTTFNIVDYYLKVPTFKLCTKIMPRYKVAKDIFDFCAAQSCSLPGPYAIPNCIPFQYVRDGCYARAHKMRQIITDRYGYCCEKVFSFSIGYPNRLAVKANKWGGCCVTWWYHVAPLVRVRIKIKLRSLNIDFVLAMVIDPSMFDKPVLLSSWLAAQEDITCSPNAKVTMYSIQPGSAYTPANGSGTAFTTDPNYTATEQTLIGYRNYTTCP
jgi:Glutaminase